MVAIENTLIAVRRTILPQSAVIVQSARMTIGLDNGTTQLRIPFAPREVNHDERGSEWSEVERPLIEPLIIRERVKLPQMSFDLVIADKQVTATNGLKYVSTAETVLQTLDTFARQGQRLRVVYGTYESGLWYLIDFSFKTEERGVNDEITKASASLTFRKVSDIQDGVGPVTGGVKPPTTTPSPPTTAPAQTGAKYYTVKAGDTLWAISIKFYGTGTKWKAIADANGVTEPKKLQIGKKLRIP